MHAESGLINCLRIGLSPNVLFVLALNARHAGTEQRVARLREPSFFPESGGQIIVQTDRFRKTELATGGEWRLKAEWRLPTFLDLRGDYAPLKVSRLGFLSRIGP